MTSVKLKLNKNRLLKDGTYPLVVQVIRHRKKAWLSTSCGLWNASSTNQHNPSGM